MGVWSNIYGDDPKYYAQYDGCVINWYERNGYNDSDWYAVVWDEQSQSVIEINYDTTRAGGGGRCEIDATDEVLRKVYRFYANQGRTHFDNVTNIRQAKEVTKGTLVRVIKGRKIPQGSSGVCFWVGEVLNRYTLKCEDRVGVEIDGEKVFLPLEYVESADWESKLVHGKDRKKAIRNFAVRSMPYWCRDKFIH